MKGMLNPWKMGLLGGLVGWANSYDRYLQQERQIQGRIQAYNAKYTAMAGTQALRAKANEQLQMLKMEAGQRTHTYGVMGDDGKAYNVTSRSVLNPTTGQWEEHELGRVPISAKGGAPGSQVKNFADGTTRQYNSDTGKWDVVASKPAGDPLARTKLEEDYKDKREKDRETAAEKKQRDANVRAANNATDKDMAAFNKMSDDDKKQTLQEAGVDPDAPNAKAKYKQFLLQDHKRDLGVSDQAQPDASTPAAGGASGGTAAAGGKPQTTPDGRQIKYGPDGTPYIKGPDGKPVPYVADANGNPDSPLAMDTVENPQNLDANGNPLPHTIDDDDEQDQGTPQDGSPLLAQNDDEQSQQQQDMQDEQENDQEDAQDDNEDQGLLSGRQQYA